MPGQVLLGHIGSGHASWPPTPTTSCAGTVIGNGIGCCRQGDSLAPHSSPSPSPAHSRAIAMGSTNVTIEGQGAARWGDAVNCGGFMVQCSDNVIIN